MEDFVSSIRTGKPPAITARDGLRATLMGRKMLDSIRTGHAEDIRLDELED